MKTKGTPVRDDHNDIIPKHESGKIYTATQEEEPIIIVNAEVETDKK